MRSVAIHVTAKMIGSAVVWAYPRDDVPEDDIGPLYEVPTYKVVVRGRFDDGTPAKREFEAIRFGVKQETTRHPPRVVGMAKKQVHTVKKWLPNYSVHSAESEERGAWQVVDCFLIHDGPDDPHDQDDPYASIGCIEICGKRGFGVFNQYLASLSGSKLSGLLERLADIGDSGLLSVHYKAALRPRLKLRGQQ